MPPKKKKATRHKAPKKAARKKAVKRAAPKSTKKKAAKKRAAPKAAKKKAVKKKIAPKKVAKKKAAKKKVLKKKTAPKAAQKPARKKAVRPQAAAKPAPRSKRAAPETREEALRRLLVQRREQIVREAQQEIAKYIKGENKQLVETALDDGDWSVIDLSEDISLRKLGAHRETLLKIDEALRKLSEGTYGRCEDCGDEINAERLRVLPFAIYCRDCQEKREELEAAREERSI